MFNYKGPIFERVVAGFMRCISPNSFDEWVGCTDERYLVSCGTEMKLAVENSSYCHYVMSVTFQETNRRTGKTDLSKEYWTSRH